MGGSHFAWNLTCGQVYPNLKSSVRLACCTTAARFLPNYASPDREVFALLRVEFLQQSAYWKGRGTAWTLGNRVRSRHGPPAARTTAAALAVSPAAARGWLRMVLMTLTTTLPSYLDQNSAPLWYEIGGRYGQEDLRGPDREPPRRGVPGDGRPRNHRRCAERVGRGSSARSAQDPPRRDGRAAAAEVRARAAVGRGGRRPGGLHCRSGRT